MQELKWEVVGSNFYSCNFFLPNKHLYSGLEEPGLKIKTFSPDCIVPVPKPGLKGLRTGTITRFSASDVSHMEIKLRALNVGFIKFHLSENSAN